MLRYKININKENITDNYVTIPVGQLFYPNVEQYESIEEKFNINNLNVINTTIDYEKVRVHPIVSNNVLLDITSLKFNLHFYVVIFLLKSIYY